MPRLVLHGVAGLMVLALVAAGALRLASPTAPSQSAGDASEAVLPAAEAGAAPRPAFDDAAAAAAADQEPAVALVPAGPEPRGGGAAFAGVHVVAPGDSLASIAATHGLAARTVLLANAALADPDLLRVGDELRIPSADGLIYTLRPGDSLRVVAERGGASVGDLLAANSFPDPDTVPAGVDVLVPGDPEALAVAVGGTGVQQAASLAAPVSLPPVTVTYEVQPGDTLASLGSKFGVGLDTLLDANDIDDPDTIRPGTTLRILPVAGIEHLVQPGERLADIAARYRVASGPIFDFNRLDDPDLIRPGDRLVIPGARRPAAGPTTAAEPSVATAPAPSAQAAAKPSLAAPASGGATGSAAPIAAPRPAAAPVPSSGPLGQRIAAIAQRYVGARYVWGGTGPNGFDCSGLVWYALQQAGAPVSRGLWGQYNAGAHPSRSQLQPGDIVFFQNTYMPGLSHDGIYIGNGLMVNAVDEASGVKVQSIDSPYWSSRWFGATRVGG